MNWEAIGAAGEVLGPNHASWQGEYAAYGGAVRNARGLDHGLGVCPAFEFVEQIIAFGKTCRHQPHITQGCRCHGEGFEHLPAHFHFIDLKQTTLADKFLTHILELLIQFFLPYLSRRPPDRRGDISPSLFIGKC